MAAGAEQLPLDQLGIQLRGFPGAAPAGTLQERPGQERAGAHPERLRAGRGPHPGGGAGKRPERRRIHHRSGRPEALYGRAGHPATLIESTLRPVEAISGEMAEWSNVPDSKSGVPQGTVGSNPTLSAKDVFLTVQRRPRNIPKSPYPRGFFVF